MQENYGQIQGCEWALKTALKNRFFKGNKSPAFGYRLQALEKPIGSRLRYFYNQEKEIRSHPISGIRS